ncbi:MAG TPA: FAD-dependent oxidoreductase, partial [Frankiaceae bacterium]|nr:FAD-dependent oxidoreductase [Frankiaceae bacterium]
MTTLSEPADRLASRFRGELIRPDDEGYEAARRAWNAAIDRRPALIARAAGSADIVAAVEVARTVDMPISIRGGGHSAAGFAVADDALMLDLSGMKAIRVDPHTRTAVAEPGVTWREFDATTGAFGLATTGGAVSSTGIAGLTLGGGIGWLDRVCGLTCDNLLGAEVVTADGQILHADAR